ncbi:major facilitator superfamily domain-containing protein [Mycena leptocephala]|nr:major facilitator superfamily domain-containing protein [Mycena leptocephala]
MPRPEGLGSRKYDPGGEQFQLEDITHTVPVIQGSRYGTQEQMLTERRLVRKLDFRLLPAMAAIFILNNIDRGGMTAARLKGFEKDLGLSDLQYSVILSIFYAVYSPAQILPSVYIGACVIAWGLASMLTGVTTNYGQVIACRIFLGLPEAAFYPGVSLALHLLINLNASQELSFRATILFAGLILANGFGSLLAAGIFSWLFLIEGSITMTMGLSMMWILPDYPYNTRWVTTTERRLAQTRIAEDAGEADKDTEADSSFRGLKMALQDPIVLLFSSAGLGQYLGTSYGIFFPTLTNNLGFNTAHSLLLAAAPWVFATIIACANAWHAGKTGERFFHMTVWWCGLIVGLIISLCTGPRDQGPLCTMSVPARYFSMFLMVCSNAASAILLPWVANAVPRRPAKRAAAIAIVNGVSNLGGCIGSYIWKLELGPGYHKSMIISLGAIAFSTLHLFTVRQLLIRKHKQLDANDSVVLTAMNSARVKDAAVLEGITYEEAAERRKRIRYLY